MTLIRKLAAGAAAAIVSCVLTAGPGIGAGSPAPDRTPAHRKTLTAFTSDKELREQLEAWAAEVRRRQAETRRLAKEQQGFTAAAPQPSAAPAQAADGGAAESVTNVQHAGVDEGGIVKLHGDHLVVLRRGRLFTIRVGRGDLAPVSSVNAFGRDIDPRGAWYDELLIAGNTIVVIGYSYVRGGTEVGLFDISPDGQLAYRGTYDLRSNDYYSSRNYASRLIGTKLILYSPLALNLWGDPFAALPAVRKWRPGATAADFKRIAPATRIYRTDEPLDPIGGIALHTVSICDLATAEMECESTAVLGPWGRVFYVSPNAVYIWAAGRSRAAGTPGSSLFRMPLDGSAPSALKVAGSPIDQLSFLEGEDGMLNVLVRSAGRGDGMWGAETNRGDLALLRVRVDRFSDGRESAPPDAYRVLPSPPGPALQNRYVGEYLLYGAGSGWHRPQPFTRASLYAVRYAERAETAEIPLGHGVDRIEALGVDALAVGSDGADLRLTSVRLDGRPRIVDTYVQPDAAQGETRTHGFFYKPGSLADGLLGIPVVRGGESAGRQLRQPSAALLYLRNQELHLTSLGTLDARSDQARQADGCQASCVDWYGNSRPLFFGGRVFALLGYELVEGRPKADRIAEVRRVNFAPNSTSYPREPLD